MRLKGSTGYLMRGNIPIGDVTRTYSTDRTGRLRAAPFFVPAYCVKNTRHAGFLIAFEPKNTPGIMLHDSLSVLHVSEAKNQAVH